MTRWIRMGYRAARRVVVAVVGGTVVLIGVCMLVLPGPAFVVIPVGLAILGLEFAWARRWLRRVKEAAAQAGSRVNGSLRGRGKTGPSAGGAPRSEAQAPRDRSAADPEAPAAASRGGSGC